MVYVYRCRVCQNQFEAEQSIKAEPLTSCDQCGGNIHRVPQRVGIAFNGSGFYSTDYRRNFSDYKKAETG